MLADLNEKDISAKLSLCAYFEIRLVYAVCLLRKGLKRHILVIHQGSSEKRQSSTGRRRVHMSGQVINLWCTGTPRTETA